MKQSATSDGSAAGDEANDAATDAALVRRTLQGDRAAFDRLVERYQRPALAIAYRTLNNMQDALELTQEAFVKAFESLDTLKTPEAFGGWFMQIVSRRALNFRRSRSTRAALPLDDLLAGADSSRESASGESILASHSSLGINPARSLESAEMGQRLKSALEQLPQQQRMAIILFTLEGLPQKQVAQMLECSVAAVKWHVFQGRKKLKELLQDYL